ncbi:hypothetical protein BUALT_Bualt01G0000300 [Buddleja alternifolia]|uniref:Uncharacterized protein n=1 Tax=Buddleja alternifolia TaxID=168488 RepID=A0AAV6Y4J0_9LAMI|nr:hypothetical protein BUALT_Bualt01G0000300 [Buddleja alternifolia]
MDQEANVLLTCVVLLFRLFPPSSPQPCKGAPTALTIDSSSSVRVKGITVKNGQQMNFVIARSASVRVIDVKVSAPEDSPNTDGIHITESTNVVLQNCRIGTGDDCISIVNASSSIKMRISTVDRVMESGSLGKDNSTGIVEKVVLDKAFIRGTMNGLRIKLGSDTVPCNHIVLNNINLQRSDGTVETFCHSAAGFGYGYIQPSAECLTSSDKDKIVIQKQEEDITKSNEEYYIHTEL